MFDNWDFNVAALTIIQPYLSLFLLFHTEGHQIGEFFIMSPQTFKNTSGKMRQQTTGELDT